MVYLLLFNFLFLEGILLWLKVKDFGVSLERVEVCAQVTHFIISISLLEIILYKI